MKVKLSEIFTPVLTRNTYSLEELPVLKLQSGFIKKMAAFFGLSFIENNAVEGNLCFAQNKAVRPEYRETFSKAEILEIVLPQVLTQSVNLEEYEVVFPAEPHLLFSESFKNAIVSKAQKKHLRQSMLKRRDKMPRKERNALSEKICQQLWGLIQEKKVQIVHSYLTMGSEVNVLPLLQKALDHDLIVVAPKTLKKRKMQNLIVTNLKNMEAGVFGTYHPKDAVEYTGEYDLIIVAGLAFDQHAYRIGYGGGYYDTFLAEHPNTFKVGTCYPFQLVESLPVEGHDIKLQKVVISSPL